MRTILAAVMLCFAAVASIPSAGAATATNQLANGDFHLAPVGPSACPNALVVGQSDDKLENTGSCGNGLFMDWGAKVVDGQAQLFSGSGTAPSPSASVYRPGLVRVHTASPTGIPLSQVSTYGLTFSYAVPAPPSPPAGIPSAPATPPTPPQLSVIVYLKLDGGACLLQDAQTLVPSATAYHLRAGPATNVAYNVEDPNGNDCYLAGTPASGTLTSYQGSTSLGSRHVIGVGVYATATSSPFSAITADDFTLDSLVGFNGQNGTVQNLIAGPHTDFALQAGATGHCGADGHLGVSQSGGSVVPAPAGTASFADTYTFQAPPISTTTTYGLNAWKVVFAGVTTGALGFSAEMGIVDSHCAYRAITNEVKVTLATPAGVAVSLLPKVTHFTINKGESLVLKLHDADDSAVQTPAGPVPTNKTDDPTSIALASAPAPGLEFNTLSSPILPAAYPVPGPGSFIVMALGAIGVALVVRRARQA